jgi:homocysteine S-methyltransferase
MATANYLPQTGDELFLTDGGLETVLIFHEGVELPAFASFVLLDDEDGVRTLRDYYDPYLDLAAESGLGFIVETPTWRASPRWGAETGFDEERIMAMNRRAAKLGAEVCDRARERGIEAVLSGNVGPHGDGYDPEEFLDAEQAQDYHSPQISTLAESGVDLITALTITYPDEAIGIVRAAVDAVVPVAISFTVETDGRLPDGTGLGDAIAAVDEATDAAPAYYMINCAHPTHFEDALEFDSAWMGRVRGLRANASAMSHAELDAAEELDDGDPADLGRRYGRLRERWPHLTVVGGCCGTDHRHVAAIRDACLPG